MLSKKDFTARRPLPERPPTLAPLSTEAHNQQNPRRTTDQARPAHLRLARHTTEHIPAARRAICPQNIPHLWKSHRKPAARTGNHCCKERRQEPDAFQGPLSPRGLWTKGSAPMTRRHCRSDPTPVAYERPQDTSAPPAKRQMGHLSCDFDCGMGCHYSKGRTTPQCGPTGSFHKRAGARPALPTVSTGAQAREGARARSPALRAGGTRASGQRWAHRQQE